MTLDYMHKEREGTSRNRKFEICTSFTSEGQTVCRW